MSGTRWRTLSIECSSEDAETDTSVFTLLGDEGIFKVTLQAPKNSSSVAYQSALRAATAVYIGAAGGDASIVGATEVAPEKPN